MTLFLLMSSLEQITQYFPAGNLWRWSNGGGDREKEKQREREREKSRERESQTSNVFGFRDKFRM